MRLQIIAVVFSFFAVVLQIYNLIRSYLLFKERYDGNDERGDGEEKKAAPAATGTAEICDPETMISQVVHEAIHPEEPQGVDE